MRKGEDWAPFTSFLSSREQEQEHRKDENRIAVCRRLRFEFKYPGEATHLPTQNSLLRTPALTTSLFVVTLPLDGPLHPIEGVPTLFTYTGFLMAESERTDRQND